MYNLYNAGCYNACYTFRCSLEQTLQHSLYTQNKYPFLRQICDFCVGGKSQVTPDKEYYFTFAYPPYA